MQVWDQDQWDEYDAQINIAFHGPDIFYGPLMNFVPMPPGANTYFTGREMLQGHVDHGNIASRQRFIDAMYVDTRGKRLVSNQRHGNKVQLDEFDELVSRYGGGTPQFMMGVLRRQLQYSIVDTYEKLARDALFTFSDFRFLGNGAVWTAGTADFSTLTATSTYQVDIRFIEDVKLRLAERSLRYRREHGTYAQPVPGENFARDLLVLSTPNVIYDIWNSPEGEWLEDLTTLQDQRIINGGAFRYKQMTFAEMPMGALFNAGVITHQCGVTSAIRWGDGAPDPDLGTLVDGVWLTGQSSDTVTHYIQCDDTGTAQFVQGDRITIHTARTTDWGITDGCDVFDGASVEAVVNSVDDATNRIVLMEPLTYEFIDAFRATPNSTAEATIYAFVTKARHVHPIVVVGSRGMCTYAQRRKIRLYTPSDQHFDLPGVHRVTWDDFGQYNRWNPYVYELLFVTASDTRSGYDQVALR
jgi:hypothetical protein